MSNGYGENEAGDTIVVVWIAIGILYLLGRPTGKRN